MSSVELAILQQYIIHIHPSYFSFHIWMHCSLHSFLEIRIIIIVIIRKECVLRCPNQTCAKARVMIEIKEVQEQMKADMEAMKEQMTTMMEATMNMRKMMEVNTATVIATSTATEVDPTHPLDFNQVNHLA